MKTAEWCVALVMVCAVGTSTAMVHAEEQAKTLPTLLIAGEVVSLDSDDPSATLMRVKDRYGFETPIFVTGQTKFWQGEEEVLKDSLLTGSDIEVEYNFDINTAKRYAVMVKLPAAETPAVAAKPAPVEEAPVSVVEVIEEASTQAGTLEATETGDLTPAP